jgi:hypothetical protein
MNPDKLSFQCFVLIVETRISVSTVHLKFAQISRMPSIGWKSLPCWCPVIERKLDRSMLPTEQIARLAEGVRLVRRISESSPECRNRIECPRACGTFSESLCLAAKDDDLVCSCGFAEERCFQWEDDFLFCTSDFSVPLPACGPFRLGPVTAIRLTQSRWEFPPSADSRWLSR